MSREYTVEEVRTEFLENFRAMANFWANLPNRTAQERCDGLAFSLLTIFDGSAAGLPAFNITANPHPHAKAHDKARGANYYPDGRVINDCSLHDLYYAK